MSADPGPAASGFQVVMTGPDLAPEAVSLIEAAGGRIHYMPPFPKAADLVAILRRTGAEALICRQGEVTAAVMDASPHLRIVARHGVGMDEVDLAAARARSLLVTNTPGANAEAVAEHTMALCFALARDVAGLAAEVAAGQWRAAGLAVRDLAGARLGLVGFGAIGQAVARLATGMGMEVAAYRPSGPGRQDAVAWRPLPALLAESDIVSLHCPLTPETTRMMAAAAFARMRRGAFLVNTARGGLVDEAALLATLDAGHLAGAGLDVLAAEPPPYKGK